MTQSVVQQTLDALLEKHELLGLSVVRRDGIPSVGAYRRSISDTTFAAMTAAMWGAAEAAFMEWTPGGPTQGLLTSDEVGIALCALDDENLLVAVAEGSHVAKLSAAVTAAADALRSRIGG